MIGPGKYDDLCTYVREKSEAQGALILIINGNKGLGFSCQMTLPDTLKMPAMLRGMADEIEADQIKGGL